MNAALFKALVDVELFERKAILNPDKGEEFSDAYFQFFGVIAVSEQSGVELVTTAVSDGKIIKIEIFGWPLEEFRKENPSVVFDQETEGIIFRSGRAFCQRDWIKS